MERIRRSRYKPRGSIGHPLSMREVDRLFKVQFRKVSPAWGTAYRFPGIVDMSAAQGTVAERPRSPYWRDPFRKDS